MRQCILWSPFDHPLQNIQPPHCRHPRRFTNAWRLWGPWEQPYQERCWRLGAKDSKRPWWNTEMDSCSKLLHQKHGFFAELQHVLMLPQAAGRLIDCTSGEAKKSVILLHSFGETSYFEVYIFSRSCLIFNAPNSGNCCHFQAMRAGIMEFGGVHEEEEEADFVAAFGTHSAMAIRRFNSVFRCSGMCRSSDLLPERLGSLAKSMVSLATVCFWNQS